MNCTPGIWAWKRPASWRFSIRRDLGDQLVFLTMDWGNRRISRHLTACQCLLAAKIRPIGSSSRDVSWLAWPPFQEQCLTFRIVILSPSLFTPYLCQQECYGRSHHPESQCPDCNQLNNPYEDACDEKKKNHHIYTVCDSTGYFLNILSSQTTRTLLFTDR